MKMHLEALTAEEERLRETIRNATGNTEERCEQLWQSGVYDAYRLLYRIYADLAGSSDSLEPLKRALFIQSYAMYDLTAFSGILELNRHAELLVMSITNRLAESHAFDEELQMRLSFLSVNPQEVKMSTDAYQPGLAKLHRYDVQEVETGVLGEAGMITGKGDIHGTFSGSEFEHNLRSLDLYVHRESSWQLYLSPITPSGAVQSPPATDGSRLRRHCIPGITYECSMKVAMPPDSHPRHPASSVTPLAFHPRDPGPNSDSPDVALRFPTIRPAGSGALSETSHSGFAWTNARP